MESPDGIIIWLVKKESQLTVAVTRSKELLQPMAHGTTANIRPLANDFRLILLTLLSVSRLAVFPILD